MKFFRYLFFFSFLLSFNQLVLSQAPGKAKRFNQISEVISGWTPNQHVWVSGNLPVGSLNLATLDGWIDENAPNWTVVLMESAQQQSFGNYRGMDAVEHALGKGLSNQTGFAKLVHPTTKQTNGAVFVLFLRERKFSYFASDVYDSRRLGEQYWIGRLDRNAINAMRNGGRIVDAAKSTIRGIDSELAKRINSEQVSRLLKDEKARQVPRKLRERIETVVKQAANLRQKNPEFLGPLAFPDEGSWRANLKAIELNLQNEEYDSAMSSSQSVFSAIDSFEQNLKAWEDVKTEISSVQKRLADSPQQSEAPRVTGLLSRARNSLAAAKRNHQYGDAVYIDQLEVASQSIAESQREQDKYQADLQAAEAQERADKVTSRSLTGGLAALIIGGLTYLNRRRREPREKARQEVEKWRTNLRGKFNRLFGLMDRASIIQRSSDDYKGVTKDLIKNSVREVDELFIMSSATDRIMERVDRLIEPLNPLTRIYNKFSSRNYKKAVALLGSKNIGFDKSQGLRAVLEPAKKTKQPRQLVGKESDYKPFSISFNRLMESYDDREAQATEKLDRLENCIDGLPLALEKSEVSLAALSKKLDDLSAAAESDGFFPLERLQEKLVPSADRGFEAAAKLGVQDPVASMEGAGSKAEQQLNDAFALVSVVESTRNLAFPEIQRFRESLDAQNFATEWIEAAYDQRSDEIDSLSHSATENSIADQIEPLKTNLLQTLGRVRNAGDLAEQLGKRLPDLITANQTQISQTREKLAESLGLDADRLFKEEDLDPDQRIKDCHNAMQMMRHAISHGNLQAAQTESQNIEDLLSESEDILKLSTNVVENGDTKAEEIEGKIEDVNAQLPEAKSILQSLKSAYQPEVLLFKERFGERISGQRSIERSVEIGEAHLAEAERFLDLARKSHKDGALILAGGEYEKAANEAGFALHQVALIKDQYTDLKKTDSANQENYEKHLAYYRSLIPKLSNNRTIQSTIDSRPEVTTALTRCSDQLQISAVKNPFQTARDLEAVKKRIAELEDKIEADWNWFATANKELKGAQEIIESGKRLVGIAKRDGITDSRKLSRAIDKHYQLENQALNWQVFLSGAHRDWEQAYKGIVEIDSEATRTRGVIERELELAQRAAKLLEEASYAISDLKNWRNSYRVSISRNAGDSNFSRSRSELGSGDYDDAIRSAQAAISAAESALRQAQSRARQERAAEEAAQRRRAAEAAAARRRSSMSSSSSGFGVGSSTHSSPSSRPSSSSSGSSGSGFSRSGW